MKAALRANERTKINLWPTRLIRPLKGRGSGNGYAAVNDFRHELRAHTLALEPHAQVVQVEREDQLKPSACGCR